MEIERRGKFPGVKIHLDPAEVKAIGPLASFLEKIDPIKSVDARPGQKVVIKLASKIAQQLKEDSSTLQQRTPEEIRTELETERDKAIEKLARLDAGKKWSSK